MQTYFVMARHNGGTYRAGSFEANCAADAVEMAEEAYRNSKAGRTMNDSGSFRFFVVSEHDYKAMNAYGACGEFMVL